MKIQLPWGNDHLTVDVPDTWDLVFPKKKDTGAPVKKVTKADEIGFVKQALKKPVGAPPVEKMKLRGKRVLIIVDDNTRPTPAHRFFHLVLEALGKAGAAPRQITVIPALGIHTRMSREEMAAKIGERNLKKIHWANHDPRDVVNLQYVGETSRGVRVELNRLAVQADFIVTIGLVEPHLWAGFGGGMKNILPGIASSATISRHHEIIAEPPYLFNRVGFAPEMNSFRLDLEEVQGMLAAPIFCLNTVLNREGMITGAYAGDPVAAHREAVKYNFDTAGLAMDDQVDGVIVSAHPMDLNFKQSMKGVGNSIPALRPGGVVMGFLRAVRGLDDIRPPQDYKPLGLAKAILRLLGPARVLWLLEKTQKNLNPEEKFLRYYSMQLMRAYELYFHVPTVTEDEVKRMGFFENFRDPQMVIERAVRKLGLRARVAVFPEAGATFPVVKNAGL
jgi:lactate racemase